MSSEARKEILKKLTAELMKTQGELSDEAMLLMDKLYNSVSQDVSDAIGMVDNVTAPYIVAVLENRADMIRKRFPLCNPIADMVKKMPTIQMVSKEVDDE